MSIKVCLCADTIYYPVGGGHLWVYLNWALGLRALGCRIIWLEAVDPLISIDELRASVDGLKCRLEPYGLAECVALCSSDDEPLPSAARAGCLDLDAAAGA